MDCGVTTGYLATVAAAGNRLVAAAAAELFLSLSLSLSPFSIPDRPTTVDAVFGSLTTRARFHCHFPLLGCTAGGLSLSSIVVIVVAAAEKESLVGNPIAKMHSLPSLHAAAC